ncbi:MAG: DNA-binding domain-containing protein [Gammaproteobacteria bacterium]
MLVLRDLQMRFAEALFEGQAESHTALTANSLIDAHIDANGIDVAERLGIYRNNLHEGFIKALALGFPVIERLVGTDYFRQLAVDFQRAHPSRAGNLHHIGAPLAQFLRLRFVGAEHAEYAYLADVAALEWAQECALIAADAPPISPDSLRAISPERYESIVFQLHTACGLVRSEFPIVRIWQANQAGAGANAGAKAAEQGGAGANASANADDKGGADGAAVGRGDDLIDLRSGGDNVLVMRAPDGVEFHQLAAGEYAALHAFAQGLNLGAALEAAQAADAELDLGAALRHWLSLGILTGLDLPAAAS